MVWAEKNARSGAGPRRPLLSCPWSVAQRPRPLRAALSPWHAGLLPALGFRLLGGQLWPGDWGDQRQGPAAPPPHSDFRVALGVAWLKARGLCSQVCRSPCWAAGSWQTPLFMPSGSVISLWLQNATSGLPYGNREGAPERKPCISKVHLE